MALPNTIMAISGMMTKNLGQQVRQFSFYLFAADLPFSFAADTIILPYSIYKQIEVCV